MFDFRQIVAVALALAVVILAVSAVLTFWAWMAKGIAGVLG